MATLLWLAPPQEATYNRSRAMMPHLLMDAEEQTCLVCRNIMSVAVRYALITHPSIRIIANDCKWLQMTTANNHKAFIVLALTCLRQAPRFYWNYDGAKSSKKWATQRYVWPNICCKAGQSSISPAG
jgi:hypothetical protein